MRELDFTHDSRKASWVGSANGHASFPIQNLPLGIFRPEGGQAPRGCVAIGDQILDIIGISGLLDGPAREAAVSTDSGALNAFVERGREAMRDFRQQLFRLLSDASFRPRVEPHLYSAATAQLQVPFAIGDYTDFYTGIHHAENIGRAFRPDNPLLPNYKHVPIGYHGRASSIRLSGIDVVRPKGQTKSSEQDAPAFGPCKRLDYELEMAIWIGPGNTLGSAIPIAEAGSHIAGLSLLNDWSARDIQAWEYQPLGPFLSKSFHSTISPWLVTVDALEPYRTAQPLRRDGDPLPLSYLLDPADQAGGAFDITMEVAIVTPAMRAAGLEPHRLSQGSTLAMYWTAAQLVAHHTSNGCNLAAGDMLGTGTLSGEVETSFGSLMEISHNGSRHIELPSGETRTFIEDGDEIIMTAYAEADGFTRIGFGECRAKIVGR